MAAAGAEMMGGASATATASIILPIPCWDSRTRQCLRAALDATTASAETEVLLVAESSVITDTMLAAFGDRVRRIATRAPFHFPAACNDGAAAARGEALIFLPFDTEPQWGWLEALLATAQVHPEAAVIGSRLLDLSETVENAGFLVGQHGLPLARYRGFPADTPAVKRSCRLAAVSAAGMLIRRDAFGLVAGFDTVYQETLFDVDLCLRLGKLNKAVWFCPLSTLIHFVTDAPAESAVSRDRQIFDDRWRHQLRPDDLPHYLDDGLLEFTYQESYPARVHLSPLLAVPDQGEWGEKTTALLELRAQQMRQLLAEHTRYVVAQADTMLHRTHAPVETIAQTKLQSLLASEQRLTFPACAHPRVSIVIPLYNQAHYTYLTLETLRATPTSVPFEVILVDDASTDATSHLLDCLDGIRIATHQKNEGFGETCNDGLALARGEFVCFLNSDVVVTPGWLDALVTIMEAHAACGAVGARLIFPDGTLQEAGSILWSDGSARGYGRGEDPNAPEYSYARAVDFCSAACLLVRKALLDTIGGFDPRYSPAYYEDVDLCLRIWAAGKSVWYAPQATVLHLEHASSGQQRAVALQLRNRATLNERWPDLAQDHIEPNRDLLRWRDRRTGERILVIDDLVPLMQIGSGFPRTAALLEALAAAGYVVTYLPATDPTPHQPMTRHLQACGIEVLHNSADVPGEIMARQDYYAAAIVSRPHNAPLIPRIRAANRGIKIIYDAEALFSLREANQARAEGGSLPAGELDRRIRAELEFVAAADLAFTVSDLERNAIQRYHPQIPIAVWGHAVPVRRPVPDFPERTMVGFVGYLASSPNNDALLHFIQKIMPLAPAGDPMMVLVAGAGASPDVERAATECPTPVTLLGYVADLAPFYDQCRVFVAPHRFAAGIPLKVVEAMANGVPCVISPVLAEQLGVTHEVEALIGRDAKDFAAQVARLSRDKALWQRVRRRAYAFIQEHYDPARMRDALRREIDQLLAGDSSPEEGRAP
jgi:GT2 family glycosyltransferase